MTTMTDAIKKALTQKRQEKLRDEAVARKLAAEAAEDPPPEMIHIKYVRCKVCKATQKYSEFLYHGGTPGFCTCKPGVEELETFHLEVEPPTEGELK